MKQTLIQRFPNNEAARIYIEQKRWNGKTVCPFCNNNKKITARKGKRLGYYRCRACGKEFTVRTGTIFERSHIPLHKWLYAIYMVVTSRKGISSLRLSKEIGITQKSSWYLLHRIREACKESNDQGGKLGGIIEMDETYIGGKEKNRHKNKRTPGTQGRSTKTKTVVVGIRSRDGKVKAKKMEKVNTDNIQNSLDSNVEDGSVLMTDEARHYTNVRGYEHYLVNHSIGEFVRHMAHVNGIESYWALLKRGFHGTFHHFSKRHTGRYVDEFAFRLNDGNCKRHTLDRMDSVIEGMVGKRLTYQKLIAE